MDEAAAKKWLIDHGVSRETIGHFELLRTMLIEENTRQNLVSTASLDAYWTRHIVDSAQLVSLAPTEANWLDLGSGVGFPGLVVAMITGQPITLVESRRLRCEWLEKCVEGFRLETVTIAASRVETIETQRFTAITARAFAPLPRLFALAHRFATPATVWILPKGRGASEELASARATWHCNVDMIDSCTDPDSRILIVRNLRPRGGRR